MRGPALTVLLGVTMLAGCERLLDIERAEAAIKGGLVEQLQMPFASVTCPETRAMKAGDVFMCTAVAQTGGDLRIQVTQTDGSGAINWKVMNGEKVLSLAKLEEQIKLGLAKELDVDAAVACGGKMRVAKAGQTLECAATAGNESRKVVVTFDDDKGNVTWAVK
jgi:hypothetical protein